VAAALMAGLVDAAQAASSSASSPASSQFCDRPSAINAGQQDKLLRFAALVRQQLDASGRNVALISRSGLDLSRFGLRYSHAGILLKADADGPWSVRQLYYACEESRPRLYDQGVAGFLLGADRPSLGHVSIVLLPEAAGVSLAHASQDRRLALDLLAARYSANAYAFSTRYQNCNQWVMELIASAWGGFDAASVTREQAQQWLQAQGYAPAPVHIGSHGLLFAAQFVPLLHVDDHPRDDLFALKLHISTPAAVEAFVHRQLPQAERVELCHDERKVVVRRGWQPLGAGCEAAPGDEVLAFD
jgi:hypothetical protein